MEAMAVAVTSEDMEAAAAAVVATRSIPTMVATVEAAVEEAVAM